MPRPRHLRWASAKTATTAVVAYAHAVTAFVSAAALALVGAGAVLAQAQPRGGGTSGGGALHFDHYTAEEGLPTDALYDIHAAADGELYIGSERGLLRYRSGVWQSLPTASGERPSLSTLHSTAAGRVFALTFDSRLYEVAADTLALHVDLRDEIDYITSWELVGDSLIVIGATGQLLVKHVDRPALTRLRAPDSLRFGRLVPLATVADTLFFDGRNSLGAVALSTGHFSRRRRFADPTQLSSTRIDGDVRIIETHRDRPSSAYRLGPLRPDTAFNRWLGPRRVVRVQQYGTDLYVATANGLVVGRPGRSRREHLAGVSVSASVALPDTRMLLATSATGGLFVAPDTEIVGHGVPWPDGVTIERVCRRGGRAVGIGTDAHFYDLGSGRRLSSGAALPPSPLPVREVVSAAAGIFVVRDGDLVRLRPDGTRDVLEGGAKAVEVLPDGTYYLGSVYHLLARPPDGPRASACYPAADRRKDYSVRAGRTLAVRQRDCDAPILIATRDDLYRARSAADARHDDWALVRGEGDRPVKTHELVDVGDAWIAATASDLYRVRKNGLPHAERVTPPALAGASLSGVRLVGDRLFVRARSGLYAVDTAAWRVGFHVGRDAGLPSDEVSDVDSVNGRFYVATPDGLFTAEALAAPPTGRPRLRPRRITTPDTTYGPTQNLTLAYGTTVEALVVDVLAPASGKAFVVEYGLDAGDDGANWRALPPGETALALGALADGRHELRVRVRDRHGRRSDEIAYRIAVATPYYRHPGFVAAVTVLAVALITSVFLARERALRRRLTLEKKVVTSEITALKSQMNPHFIFNALNSIQDLILLEDVGASRDYLGKFSRLMREVLEKSSAELISVEQEVEMLRVYLQLEQLRFTDRFTFAIAAERGCLGARLPPLMVQPYVENALKHGLIHRAGAQRLTVRFEARTGGGTRCTIDDNGIGRVAAAAIRTRRARRHRSFAMASNERRIDLLNRLLDLHIGVEVVDKPDGGGTTVVIDVPPLERVADTVREVGARPREV